jgi:hypothetical protein
MATTTNFGWDTPDDTDLVKDGAAAIRTLGSNIDTSLVDLNGGTTGQYLQKASGTDLDFTWAGIDAGGMTSIATGTLSGTEVSITSIPSGYINLMLLISNPFVDVSSTLAFRLNSVTTSTYRVRLIRVTQASLQADGPTTYLDANGNTVGLPTSTSTISSFLDIRNYTSTQFKNIQLGYASSNESWSGAGFAPVSAAITSIQIRTQSGTANFSGGTYTLYGVK